MKKPHNIHASPEDSLNLVVELLLSLLPQLSVSSGDLALGTIITFSVGSKVNSIGCADVTAVDDTALESEETFTVFVLNYKIRVEVFTSDVDVTIVTTRAGEQVSFPLVPPNEDVSVTIDTSDTQGQYI